jgi:hypothetical protein
MESILASTSRCAHQENTHWSFSSLRLVLQYITFFFSFISLTPKSEYSISLSETRLLDRISQYWLTCLESVMLMKNSSNSRLKMNKSTGMEKFVQTPTNTKRKSLSSNSLKAKPTFRKLMASFSSKEHSNVRI